MGMTSDWAIELHNERLDTDEEYAAGYQENMRIDAALEAEWFEQERARETQMEWFTDRLFDHRGAAIELPPEPAAVVLTDDDLPF